MTEVTSMSETNGSVERLVMRFKDLPVGARFKYPDSDSVWVAIETFNDGLVAKWEGLNSGRYQSRCSFVDEDWALESEVEVIA